MAKKSGLSIRYKILLLLTLLPLVTLTLFLIMAMGIFESDKIAYVFESSSSVSKTLSAQVSGNLNSTLMASRPIMQEFIYSNEFGSVSKSLFESEGMTDWIAAYALVNGQASMLDLIERTPNEGTQTVKGLGNLTEVLKEAAVSGRLVRVPFKDERVLLIEKVSTPTGEKFFLIMSKMKELEDIFHTPSSSEIFLINPNGYVLIGSNSSEGTYISEKMDVEVTDSIKDKKFTAGTEELKTSKGETWLASFSKVPFGELYVVSLIPKNEALKAVQVLLRKSIIFFLFLASATTIISLFASKTLTGALTDLFSATKKVAEGRFDIRVKVNSSDEIGSLAESFNAMAEEVSRLMLETAEKARMEGELKTAQTVQETLFPAAEANLEGFKIAGHYEPASECGGDWWHYCKVGKKVFLWIGDATGHGAPAALITSAAKSAATIIETLNVEPSVAMAHLNRAIYDVSKGRIMMTFFLACFDQETHELTYANASHEAPFLIKVQEGLLKKKNLIPLNEVNSPRLGQSRDTQYQQTHVKLDLGDRVFFYTDGLPDIQNPEKTGWGEREFIKGILAVNQSYPPVENSVKMLVEMFSSYRQGAPLIDDITFFMTHYEGDLS